MDQVLHDSVDAPVATPLQPFQDYVHEPGHRGEPWPSSSARWVETHAKRHPAVQKHVPKRDQGLLLPEELSVLRLRQDDANVANAGGTS